ncbi:hypothetical protein HS088_TW09G00965 [Tripterygium wilfordii]|uniref:Uncharacterized protein n=2 Tax=Tripterygium wilfordii TaxID=458696 RepID=A0A7J7D985_TRIWF|nr:hypothetical protein HS088_TW09G00965 [Tripterygium wilfordii]
MPLSVYNCQIRHTSSKAQMIEVELDSSSSPVSSSSSSYSDGRGLDFSLAVQKMEDLIQVLLVQKSTPNWLPFIPGSSFWVPPHSPTIAPDLIIKLVDQLTEDEIRAVTTLRGWPSSSYFIPEVEAEVLEEANTDLEMQLNTSQSKDTEG